MECKKICVSHAALMKVSEKESLGDILEGNLQNEVLVHGPHALLSGGLNIIKMPSTHVEFHLISSTLLQKLLPTGFFQDEDDNEEDCISLLSGVLRRFSHGIASDFRDLAGLTLGFMGSATVIVKEGS